MCLILYSVHNAHMWHTVTFVIVIASDLHESTKSEYESESSGFKSESESLQKDSSPSP